jgi:hypothetical protein
LRQRRAGVNEALGMQCLQRASDEVFRHPHAPGDRGGRPALAGTRAHEKEHLEHLEACDEVTQQGARFLAQLVIHERGG